MATGPQRDDGKSLTDDEQSISNLIDNLINNLINNLISACDQTGIETGR